MVPSSRSRAMLIAVTIVTMRRTIAATQAPCRRDFGAAGCSRRADDREARTFECRPARRWALPRGACSRAGNIVSPSYRPRDPNRVRPVDEHLHSRRTLVMTSRPSPRGNTIATSASPRSTDAAPPPSRATRRSVPFANSSRAKRRLVGLVVIDDRRHAIDVEVDGIAASVNCSTGARNRTSAMRLSRKA